MYLCQTYPIVTIRTHVHFGANFSGNWAEINILLQTIVKYFWLEGTFLLWYKNLYSIKDFFKNNIYGSNTINPSSIPWCIPIFEIRNEFYQKWPELLLMLWSIFTDFFQKNRWRIAPRRFFNRRIVILDTWDTKECLPTQSIGCIKTIAGP